MKTIGIVTFHYADNYGAVLQTYALKRVIDSFDGCKSEIINYIPPNKRYYYFTDEEKAVLEKKRPLFERFLIDNCGLNGEKIDYILDNNRYDYYCVGSDQIWNFDFSAIEYLLPKVRGVKKIAYAASIGMSVDDMTRYIDYFRKYLPSFKSISVRESEHVRLIEKYSNKECKLVVDPTLLLDEKEYRQIETMDELEGRSYLLFYWIPHDKKLIKGLEYVNKIAMKYDLKILHNLIEVKNYMFINKHRNICGCNIGDFLWYIKNARFVITNSYHVTLFSMQYNIPFYILPEEKMYSRFRTIGDLYGIEDRIIQKYIAYDDISERMDFKHIKECLDRERESSIAFLKEALDEHE